MNKLICLQRNKYGAVVDTAITLKKELIKK